MVDLRLKGNNNRFKSVEAIVTEPYATTDQLVATLPVGEFTVVNAYLVVIEPDSKSDASMDVKLGENVILNEVRVDLKGTKNDRFTPVTVTTGGDITIVAGDTAPAGDGLIRLVLEVVPLNQRDGKYIS